MRHRQPREHADECPGDTRSPARACRWRRADRQLLAHRRSCAATGRARVAPAPSPPGSLKTSPYLDSWIRIDGDGGITVFTGKAEIGQGFKTACRQIAAEELEVPFESLTLVTPDTTRTSNEGFTAGSHSVQDSGTAIRMRPHRCAKS